MVVTDGVTKYHVHFWIEPADWVARSGGRVVRARIHAGACDDARDERCRVGVIAFACCHPRDQFRKETGRRVALGRAMVSLIPDKRVRQDLWIDYLRQKGLFVVRVDPATGLPPNLTFAGRG